jgi:hypothetical protein
MQPAKKTAASHWADEAGIASQASHGRSVAPRGDGPGGPGARSGCAARVRGPGVRAGGVQDESAFHTWMPRIGARPPAPAGRMADIF